MTAAHPTKVLAEKECWARLAATELGRMAYHLADEVHIAPVNYAVEDGRIIFRTAEGSKLLGVVMNEDVAFEIDHVDDDRERAWSVVARGKASLLEGRRWPRSLRRASAWCCALPRCCAWPTRSSDWISAS